MIGLISLPYLNIAKMMIIKVNSIKNRTLKRFVEHSVYLTILFVLIPSILYFEVTVVLPSFVQVWTTAYFIHIVCITFLLINIMGNMIYGIFTNTSIRGKYINGFNKDKWSLCTVCEVLRPPRAWHCDTCDVCILKRDHHCTFLACCVGYYNFRYFMLFVLYIFLSMLYAFTYNVQFLAKFLCWNNGLIIVKFILPFVSLVIDFGHESIYILLVIINVILTVFTGFLFCFHFNNILNGKTTPEQKDSSKDCYNRGWKSNIVEVFGTRWYLTWITPFIQSPLPGDGIQWDVNDKYK